MLVGQQPALVRPVGFSGNGQYLLGIAFKGLVLDTRHQGVRSTDPYAAARRAVTELRGRGCSLVICLSHLGYRYRGDQPSDTLLAQEVEGIDLILGGHTHTFMDEPDVHLHAGGGRTLVNQVGFAGIRLGRVDVVVEPGGADRPGPRWAAGHYTVDGTTSLTR